MSKCKECEHKTEQTTEGQTTKTKFCAKHNKPLIRCAGGCSLNRKPKAGKAPEQGAMTANA